MIRDQSHDLSTTSTLEVSLIVGQPATASMHRPFDPLHSATHPYPQECSLGDISIKLPMRHYR